MEDLKWLQSYKELKNSEKTYGINLKLEEFNSELEKQEKI